MDTNIAQTPAMSYFQSLLSDPCSQLTEQAIGDGDFPIGYTCSYVPEALLSVGNLVPVRLRAPGVTGTEIADIYLSSVICSYTRSLLEFAMDDRYDFLKGWVFTAGCDHLRRLYDNLKYTMDPDFIHIIDVPHRAGEHQLNWFIDALNIMIEKLSSQFGINYTGDTITQAINQHNTFNGLLADIGDLRKQSECRISGTDFHTLMLATQVAPRKMLLEKVQSFKDDVTNTAGTTDYRARLVIVGGQLDDPGYINIIESTGALVVADILCTGSIPGLSPIHTKDDPVADIARHYLNRVSCPRMMEGFDCRVETIVDTVAAYKADGVIIEFVKFCDTWGVEANLLASTLRKKGIPAMCLEREYRRTGEGQLTTRIQAFIESMGK